MSWLYNYLFLPVALAVLPVAKIFIKKLSLGLKARKNLFAELEQNLRKFEPSRPRVLVHSTSVGEWLQAEPIVALLKKRFPQMVVVVSFFSPSGYDFVAADHALIDVKTYLPLDTRSNAKRFFSIIQPKFWLISKLDVWANHLWQAKKLGIKVFLSCATLTKLSGRDKGLAALFHRRLYANIDAMFPISIEDEKRLGKLYQGKMVVCGDTKHDLVVRAATRDFATPLHYQKGDVVFVAGSIWLQGARVLFPALKKILADFPSFKLILAPHDLRFVPQFLQDFAGSVRYSRVQTGQAPQVVVVDSIGQLAGLYRLAHIAYVGGGFADFGLHNVVETAVFAPLLLVGAKFHSSHEAEQLAEQGALSVISTEKQVEKLLRDFMGDKQIFAQERKACGDYVRKNQGATARVVEQILAEVGDEYFG